MSHFLCFFMIRFHGNNISCPDMCLLVNRLSFFKHDLMLNTLKNHLLSGFFAERDSMDWMQLERKKEKGTTYKRISSIGRKCALKRWCLYVENGVYLQWFTINQPSGANYCTKSTAKWPAEPHSPEIHSQVDAWAAAASYSTLQHGGRNGSSWIIETAEQRERVFAAR